MAEHRARIGRRLVASGRLILAAALAALLLASPRGGVAALSLSDLRVEPGSVEAYGPMTVRLRFAGAGGPIARLWVRLAREGQEVEPAAVEMRPAPVPGPAGGLWFSWEMGGPGAYRLSVAAEEAGGERSGPQTLALLVREPARPYEELAYPSDGLKIKGYLYRPPGAAPAPAIVFNHGSRRREELSQAVRFEWLAYRLARLGYVVFVPERRGYAGSEGQGVVSGEGLSSLRHGLPGEVKDVTAAVGFLAGRPEVDAGRIALVGKSLGGMVGLLAAAEEPRVRAVASLAGGYGFGDRTTGVAVFYVEQALRDAAKRVAVPTLLLHAENDRVVPIGLSRSVRQEIAARGVPVALKEYPPLQVGGKDVDGHRLFDGVSGLKVFWKDLTDFLADTVGPARRPE
jgi:dienelactone hydrolase